MAAPAATPSPDAYEEPPDLHERNMEEREAYEYWGYLFKNDKTGTDKLKSLLRGLKDVMNKTYEPSGQPDLLPTQLASYYRELHGNYDQLFLGTPSESIAFIYKSLGCLHSLQPQSLGQSTAFTDPTVPALKTQGWIMWQTIQILLGPEEHSGFLIEAVQKWDVRDPSTGDVFPKILPRRCFPSEPDKHMVAWYEGVSERLKKEAESEEEKQKLIEDEKEDMRRHHNRSHVARKEEKEEDDSESVDSRGPALAYFRNPLYRHVDGRPSIVRKTSRRPTMSPRPTSSRKGKGKEAATTVGHIVKNIGSPHLWDGGRAHSRTPSRDHRDSRRRSLPDQRHPHHYVGDVPVAAVYVEEPSPHEIRHHRQPSSHLSTEHVPTEDGWDGDGSSAIASPRPIPHHRHRPQISRDDSHLRPSRSHEPTPSHEDPDDYFAGYEATEERRSSLHESPSTPGSGSAHGSAVSGAGFAPSASPLFATHIARQPQPQAIPVLPHHLAQGPRVTVSAEPLRKSPSVRRAHYSRSPERRPSRRSGESPRRPRFEQSPAGYDDAGLPPPRPGSGRPLSRSMDESRGRPYPYPPPPPPAARPPPKEDGRHKDERRHEHRHHHHQRGRNSGSEHESEHRRHHQPKQTRFADSRPPPPGEREREGRPVSGVDGRRYADASPWR